MQEIFGFHWLKPYLDQDIRDLIVMPNKFIDPDRELFNLIMLDKNFRDKRV